MAIDAAGATKVAARQPAPRTDVLLSCQRREARGGPASSIVELLALREAGEIAFDLPRIGEVSRSADSG